MSSMHVGVTCNVCSRRDFRLRRYKCLICRDFDLCGACFDDHRETSKHSSSHPMQCLITKSDHNLFYSGEDTSNTNVQSYTCPICGQLGFTDSSLSNHVFLNHPSHEHGDIEVLCPFCAIQTEGDPNRQTHNLANHFITVHHLAAPSSAEARNGNSSRTEDSAKNRLTNSSNTSTRSRLSHSTLLRQQSLFYNSTLNQSTNSSGNSNRANLPPTATTSRSSRGVHGALRTSALAGRNSHNDGLARSSTGVSVSRSGPNRSTDSRAVQRTVTIDAVQSRLNVLPEIHTTNVSADECSQDEPRLSNSPLPGSHSPSLSGTTTGAGETVRSSSTVQISNTSASDLAQNTKATEIQTNIPHLPERPKTPLKPSSGDIAQKESHGGTTVDKVGDDEKKSVHASDVSDLKSSEIDYRDDLNIDWFRFINELAWSSLCNTTTTTIDIDPSTLK